MSSASSRRSATTGRTTPRNWGWPPVDGPGARGCSHRRLDFEPVAVAESLRAEFAATGWDSQRLVWMRHEARAPAGPEVAVEIVDYDAVEVLRDGSAEFRAQAGEVALRLGVQVLAVLGEGAPIAFAQLERAGAGAEIVEIFVHPDHRGRGLGTAVTRAAIHRADRVDDRWICADDEDRAKDLYARLGFRAAWTTIDFCDSGRCRRARRAPSGRLGRRRRRGGQVGRRAARLGDRVPDQVRGV